MYGANQHDIVYYPSQSQLPLPVVPPEQTASHSDHSASHPAMGFSPSSHPPHLAPGPRPPVEQSEHRPQTVSGWNGPSEFSGPREPYIESTLRPRQDQLEPPAYADPAPIIIQGPSVPYGFKAPFPTPEATELTNQVVEPWFYSPVSPAPSVYPIYAGSRVLDDVPPLADDADEWAVWSRSEAAVTIVPPSPLRTVCKRCYDHRVECSWPGVDGAGACSNCFFSYSLCSIVQPSALEHPVRPTLESIPSTEYLDGSKSGSPVPSDLPISSSSTSLHERNNTVSGSADPGTPRARSASLSVPPLLQPPIPSSASSSSMSRTPEFNRSASQTIYPSHHPAVITPSDPSLVTNPLDQRQSSDPPRFPSMTSSNETASPITCRPMLPTPQASSSSSTSESKTASPDLLSIDPDRFVFRNAGRDFPRDSSLVPPSSSSRTVSLTSSASSSRPYSTINPPVRFQPDNGPDSQIIELFDRVVRLQSDATAGLVQVRSVLKETESSSAASMEIEATKKEKRRRKKELKRARRREKELLAIEGSKKDSENESMDAVVEETQSQTTAGPPIAGTDKQAKPI